MPLSIRIGQGYDVHRLVKGRPLFLGGVKIKYKKGLDGHSDADVLCHAIADALLGAAGLGDIGRHFPDNDEKYKNISGEALLAIVISMINEKNFSVVNVDATVAAERPKLEPHKKEMEAKIADALHIDSSRVNVKATTEEGLGFTGKGRAISARVVCLLDGGE